MSNASGKIRVAVIEGWHPFEVPPFHQWLRTYDDVDYYPQVIDDWAFNCGGFKDDYDVLMFYNMNMPMDDAPFRESLEKTIQNLGEARPGIIMLHHAILAYPDNAVWSDVVGIQDRSFGYHPDQDYTVEVANSEHPISKGLDAWALHDETYTMADAGEGSEVLFTTRYETSMKTIGWIRTYKNSRVFCFQPGHDHVAWENPAFREIMHRAIRWCAGRA